MTPNEKRRIELMLLPEYKNVPFDYEDFINNTLFEIQYNLVLLEDFWFMNHPVFNKILVKECKIKLIQLKAMARIPKKELDNSRITKQSNCEDKS